MNADPETGEILEQTPEQIASEKLSDYTSLKRQMEWFQRQHEQIISEYFNLQDEVDKAEAELKTAARISGPIENESFTVSVVTPMTRWYDADIILEKAPYVKDLPGVMITSVDKKKIETLAKGGMIAKEIADLAYREEAGTPRVTIKVKTA